MGKMISTRDRIGFYYYIHTKRRGAEKNSRTGIVEKEIVEKRIIGERKVKV
jgi:hypothetical protein